MTKQDADSSVVQLTTIPLKPYTEYIDEGNRIKSRGEGMEDPIQSHISYMEATYHLVMAAHQLEIEFTSAKMEKNGQRASETISKKILLLANQTMELCYRIRTYEQKAKHDLNLSNSEKKILDRLIIMCYKCEAHLNLLMYKCDNGKTDMLSQHEKIKKIFTAKLEKKVNIRHFKVN